jgi:hypothetical protein
MIAASALILLAEATANCTLPGGDWLAGDAMVVRPVGTFEPIPFERLGPATSIHSDGGKIHQTQATPEANQEPDADRPAEQCKAVAIPII